MNKLALSLCIVLAIIYSAFAAPNEISHNDGGDWTLKIGYPAPEAGEDARVRFRAKLEDKLGVLDTHTTICFNTDSSYNLNVGDSGFGIQFLCTIHKCNSNDQLHAVLFKSTVKSTSPVTWTGAGSDFSSTNKGTPVLRSGKKPDTVYGMSTQQFDDSELPAEGENVHLKCFTNKDGSYYETNLNTDLTLESDDPMDDDWTMHTVTLNPASA